MNVLKNEDSCLNGIELTVILSLGDFTIERENMAVALDGFAVL